MSDNTTSGKDNPEPGFSPKPANPTTTLESTTGASPSPSLSPEPRTPSPYNSTGQ